MAWALAETGVKAFELIIQLFQQHDQFIRVWHLRRTAGVLVFVAALLGFFGLPVVVPDVTLWSRCTGALIFGVLALPIWYFTSRLPKAEVGTIGLAVSIVCDDEDQSKRLRNDFVSRLRVQCGNWQVNGGAHVLQLPGWVAESLEEARNDTEFRSRAGDIAGITRCDFLLTARATLRDDGKPIHFLRMRGLVRHAPIQEDDAAKFAREFTEIFPSELAVSLENDFRQFESHARHLDLIARYVTGVAAGLSKDFVFAEQQFADLLVILNREETQDSTTSRLCRRSKRNLQQCRDAYNTQLVQRYRRSRDTCFIDELERRLLVLPANEQQRPDVQMSLALADFVLRRDTEGARARLITNKDHNSPEWQFNMAFIDAIEGNLQSAYKHYQNIERMDVDSALTVDVEEFIQIVLDEDPERKQLLFLTGMINRSFKNDVQAAKRDLKEFKKWAKNKSEFSAQVAATVKWLKELRYKRA